MKLDLHVHSTYSDGAYTPQMLIDTAASIDLNVISITDHDNVLSYQIACDYIKEKGLDIEFVEQPVKGHDFDGLKYVTERSYVPVLADESVFSPEDALKIMQMRAADMVNIKLMKCGGLYNALKIASAAEVYGVECMIGCMLEAKISVNAAVHLACAKQIITKIDLDGPVLCSEDPILGGATFNEKIITVSDEPGLGIKGIEAGKIKYL